MITQEEEKGGGSALNPGSRTLVASGPIMYPFSLKPQFPDLSCRRQGLTAEAEIACTYEFSHGGGPWAGVA